MMKSCKLWPVSVCKERPDLAGRLHRGVLWSPSYFAASCGGAPLLVVREYVESQRTPLKTGACSFLSQCLVRLDGVDEPVGEDDVDGDQAAV